jgi:hypothetical protein
MNFNNLLLFSFVIAIPILSIAGCEAQGEKSSRSTTPVLITASENKSKTYDVAPFYNGFNAQLMRGPSWHEEGFVAKVKGLYPGVLRYPGGTVASYWDWKTGWLMEGIQLKKEWNNIPRNPIKLEDFKYACEQTGADPLFVLNMVHSTLSYQLDMLISARNMGMHIKFVELDNELYTSTPAYVKRFASGREYAIESNKWIAAIKKEFPAVKIAVVGNSARETKSSKNSKSASRASNWNRDVLAVLNGGDAMTFHVYGGTGLKFLSEVREAENEDSESETDAAATTKTASRSAFENEENISLVLSTPFMRWKSSNSYDYKILPQGMRAWITEYNLFDKEGIVYGTWAHGLYAAMQTLLFMENPLTEMVCYHNLSSSAQFAAIFNNSEGLAKSAKPTPVKALDYTAAGHCLSLTGKALSEAGHGIKLQFSNNSSLQGSRGQDYSALNGWVIKRKSGKKIIVVNLAASSLEVDFTTVIQGATFTQLYADARKVIASDADISRLSGNSGKIMLPAYSITLIEGE